MSIPRPTRRWLWVVLGTVLPSGCWREIKPPREVKAEEFWMGAYLGQQRIGFVHTRVEPSLWQGQPVVRVESTSIVKVALMGVALEEKIHVVQITDLEFSPKSLTFTMSSGGRNRSLVATFFPERVECQLIASEEATETRTVPIPAGVKLVADEQALLEGKGTEGFKEGQSLEMYQFNPVTLTIDKMTLTLLRREEMEFEGTRRQTLLFEHKMPLATSQIWVDAETGDILKMTAMNLLTFLREPQEKATQFPEAKEGLVDLALALSVRPQQPIPNPRECALLRLKVWGLEVLERLPSDEWQEVLGKPGQGEAVEILIRAQPFEAEKAQPLPLRRSDLEPWLKPGPYVEADHPEILAKAREIVGEERNAYRAAQRIRDWVHQHIEWRYDIGVIRSALQILRDPAGVCRDASVLYTALARAAGLPTRICVGLVYVREGFYGHAWAETYVGEGRWVPFDPAMSAPFVDATHFKLGQGEYTELFQAIKALPGMRIEVLEWKTRSES